MANCDQETLEISEIQDDDDQNWEERSLNLLEDSKIDQEFSEAKTRKKCWRKHRVRWMKRPMAVPDVILELQDEDLRENALRCLSNYLLERREKEPDNYNRTGFLLFHSCATMAILLQEVLVFYWKLSDGTLNVRSSKRLANVLTLFQSIAANKETRLKFVRTAIPNSLMPLIQFDCKEEVFENIRAIALSVFGIICQTREPELIQWAVESNIVEVCRSLIEIGNEVTKVIAMHILEAILQDRSGISYICNPMDDHPLKSLMQTWGDVVAILSVHQDFSPRLFFHIIRCYVLLCAHKWGFSFVVQSLPVAIINDSFQDIINEFPVIRKLLHQLLLNIGKSMEIPMS